MRAPREPIDLDAGSTFRFLHRRAPRLSYNPHRHPLYELICHPDGSGAVFAGERIAPYAGPCAFLIGPDLPHTYRWDPPPGRTAYACWVLQFGPDLAQRLAAFPEALELAPLLRAARRGAAVVGAPAAAIANELTGFAAASGVDRLARLLRSLDAFARGDPRPLAAPRRAVERDDRIGALQRWIQERLDQPISLAALGRVAGMHPRSVARAFRRATGHSVVGYANALRVGRACELLAATDAAVVDCCHRAGFGNLAHFNRLFRRHAGTTPTRYRRLARGG